MQTIFIVPAVQHECSSEPLYSLNFADMRLIVGNLPHDCSNWKFDGYNVG